MKKEVVAILITFFLFFIPINSMADEISIITAHPTEDTLIGRGNTVIFTVAFNYTLDSEDTGMINLWILSVDPVPRNPNCELVDFQEGELAIVAGTGTGTLETSAKIVCADGREIIELKVGASLTPEGAMGGPYDDVYYNTGPYITERNFAWPMFLPAIIGTP